ncbi:hypothetical protein ACOSP7_013628 [Xanthoceras sorbifolium]
MDLPKPPRPRLPSLGRTGRPSHLTENLLTGNIDTTSLGESESAVSRVVELSERFGWDNVDKVRWSKVDFQLLGTSNGTRDETQWPFLQSLTFCHFYYQRIIS